MLGYIYGRIAEITPTFVVIDNQGRVYIRNVCLNSYNVLQSLKSSAKLFVYEAIREDAHVLYGFTDKHERELFLQLISVSGVGANSARMILSSYTPSDVEQIITQGNATALKSVKGIGAKTAERIIVDLKDKIKVASDALLDMSKFSNASFDEALSALMMLGFTKQMSQKALKKLFTSNPALSVEEAIKKALKMM